MNLKIIEFILPVLKVVCYKTDKYVFTNIYVYVCIEHEIIDWNPFFLTDLLGLLFSYHVVADKIAIYMKFVGIWVNTNTYLLQREQYALVLKGFKYNFGRCLQILYRYFIMFFKSVM